MSQFNNYVKIYFSFLQQYGYIYVRDDSEYSVSIEGKNNRIEVFFSILGYELTCQFVDNVKNNFTLQDALEYINMKECKGIYQISNKEEIEKGIIYLADVVKNLFDIIDISNSVNFQKIFQYRFDMHKELLKNYYFKVDMKMAEEYMKKGEFFKAQKLYEQHINCLTKVQMKKLEYIRKKYKKC